MTIHSILACVDFTEQSLSAARWAALQLAPDAHVILTHVVPTPEIPSFLRTELRSPSTLGADFAPRMRRALRGFARSLGEHRTSVRILVGRPEEAICALAAEVNADLIVLGRGVRRRGSARFGGTVTTRVLAASSRPVLIAHDAFPRRPRRIVAAVDHHPSSGYLLESACNLVADARVDAIHVVDPQLTRYLRAFAARAAFADASAGARAERWLDLRVLQWLASMAEAVSPDVGRLARVVGHGDPGEQILRHARAVAADLVVVGAGGDGVRQPGRLGVGSAARLVSWAAPCAVLVVPTIGADAEPYAPVVVARDDEVIPPAVLARLRGTRTRGSWPQAPGDGAA